MKDTEKELVKRLGSLTLLSKMAGGRGAWVEEELFGGRVVNLFFLPCN